MEITITEAMFDEAYKAWYDSHEGWDGDHHTPWSGTELFQTLVGLSKQSSKPPIDKCNNITYKG